MDKKKVLIAGIAGASLGTEIAKSLRLSGGYKVFGSDISKLAYGHFESDLFDETFLVNVNNYVESTIDLCQKNDINYILPGGEKPLSILSSNQEKLIKNGIELISNSKSVIEICSNKVRTFEKLAQIDVPIPFSKEIAHEEDLKELLFPCVFKPSVGTGGSDSVFLVANYSESLQYFELFKRNKRTLVAQEYIPIEEGEFTIGVLSLPDQKVVGAIVMERIFNSKLSVAFRSKLGLISSGYSQGLIKKYPEIESTCIKIAKEIGSTGPLNIQGRVRDNKFYPFEINPRFSASTYLRSLAGFNEVEMYLENILSQKSEFLYQIKEGYYLRSFQEEFVPLEQLNNVTAY